jgi:hypothetical protein
MGLEASDCETPTATFDELEAFRKKAIEMGLQSLAIAALMGLGAPITTDRKITCRPPEVPT